MEHQNVASITNRPVGHFRVDPVYYLDGEIAAPSPFNAAGFHERLLNKFVVAAALMHKFQAVEGIVDILLRLKHFSCLKML